MKGLNVICNLVACVILASIPFSSLLAKATHVAKLASVDTIQEASRESFDTSRAGDSSQLNKTNLKDTLMQNQISQCVDTMLTGSEPARTKILHHAFNCIRIPRYTMLRGAENVVVSGRISGGWDDREILYSFRVSWVGDVDEFTLDGESVKQAQSGMPSADRSLSGIAKLVVIELAQRLSNSLENAHKLDPRTMPGKIEWGISRPPYRFSFSQKRRSKSASVANKFTPLLCSEQCAQKRDCRYWTLEIAWDNKSGRRSGGSCRWLNTHTAYSRGNYLFDTWSVSGFLSRPYVHDPRFPKVRDQRN